MTVMYVSSMSQILLIRMHRDRSSSTAFFFFFIIFIIIIIPVVAVVFKRRSSNENQTDPHCVRFARICGIISTHDVCVGSFVLAHRKFITMSDTGLEADCFMKFSSASELANHKENFAPKVNGMIH